MREMYSQKELINRWQQGIIEACKKHGFDNVKTDCFVGAHYAGYLFGLEHPIWIPYKEQKPQNGDKVLVFLDDETMTTYTYYDNNKGLVQLFKNHVIAWMYQPNKPIFKTDEL